MFNAPLAPGMPAPPFTLAGHDGNSYSLPSGRPAVLVFYPADDTPG